MYPTDILQREYPYIEVHLGRWPATGGSPQRCPVLIRAATAVLLQGFDGYVLFPLKINRYRASKGVRAPEIGRGCLSTIPASACNY